MARTRYPGMSLGDNALVAEDCISLSPLFLLWFCKSEVTTVPLWVGAASFFLPKASTWTAENLHLPFCASFRIFCCCCCCSLAPCHQLWWDPGQGSSATQPRYRQTANPKGQIPGVRFPLKILQLGSLPPALPPLSHFRPNIFYCSAF